MKKRIVNITIAIALAAAAGAYLAVALSRAHRQLDNVVCNKLQVVIQDSALNQLVRKDDIPAIFRASKKAYFGKRLCEISTHELEEALRERSLIKRAEVHTTADGTLHVSIVQRRPIARVFADNEQSFYIDADGYVLQPYSGYTSHVPVVSGHISSPFPRGFKGSMMDFFREKKLSNPLYAQLYDFAKFLSRQPFWQAQVEQIYLTPDGKVELIPRVGAQLIRLGSFDNFEYKLHKLLTLYEKGMGIRGWNAYDVVDLSYSNQVVCKRR